jgi:hypothetical protein
MSQNVPLINGTRHSFASIELVLFGITITGFTAISYKVKQAKTNEYGAGNEPVHRGLGNKEYEASITLMKYEVDRILRALPAGQTLLDIAPFNIAVVYKPQGSDLLITDVLQNCEFTEMGVDTKQGDTKIEVPLPLLPGSILFNKR